MGGRGLDPHLPKELPRKGPLCEFSCTVSAIGESSYRALLLPSTDRHACFTATKSRAGIPVRIFAVKTYSKSALDCTEMIHWSILMDQTEPAGRGECG